jgi:hypothetical protein
MATQSGPNRNRRPIEETLAENWAHDNLLEDEYDDERVRMAVEAAYVAGFRGAQ